MNSGAVQGRPGGDGIPADISKAPGMRRERISALVLDDSTFDRRRLMRDCRKAGLDISFTEVSTITAMCEALDKGTFDLVFVDYRLTDGSGLIALEQIYGHPWHLDCATIMIAGDGDTEIAVKAVRLGCSDYIEKSRINPDSICSAVIAAVQKSRLRREIAATHGMNLAMMQMIDEFADDCLHDMKPILTRMLRQVRRQRQSPDGAASAELMEDFEASCCELRDFLQRIEDNVGDLRHRRSMCPTNLAPEPVPAPDA